MHVVSLKVYNVLGQLVAIPKLEGGSAPNAPVSGLKLACGQYKAFWDGKVLSNGKEAASSVYIYELTVDGDRAVKKAFVAK